MDKLAAVLGVGPPLPESFIALAVLESEIAIGLLKLDALDDEKRVPVLIMILIFGDDNFRLTGTVFAISLRALGLGLRPRQRFTGSVEINAVQVLDKLDNVATDIAVATVKEVFLGMDGEAIIAAAFRAGANQFIANTPELYAAPMDFISNRRAPCAVGPVQIWPAAPHGRHAFAQSGKPSLSSSFAAGASACFFDFFIGGESGRPRTAGWSLP
jgi:hypothetical protein